MQHIKRQVLGLLGAPIAGAATFVVWGWVFHSLRPTDADPGPLWYQIRTGMPIGYIAAVIATWPAIILFTCAQWRSFIAFVGAAVVSSGLFALILLAMFGLDAFRTAARGAFILGFVIAFPSVIAYWLAVEATRRFKSPRKEDGQRHLGGTAEA